MAFENIHFVINGEEVCFTELLNMILEFVKKIVKFEFPEVGEVL